MPQQQIRKHGWIGSPGRNILILLGTLGSLVAGLVHACESSEEKQFGDANRPGTAVIAAPGPKVAQQLYRRYCQRCHAEDGTGRRSRAHLPEIPDFTRTSWQTRHSDAALRVSILTGHGARMPSFSERISGAEAKQLAELIRSFGPRKAHSTAVPKRDIETRFSTLQRELEELQRQFRQLSSPRRKRTSRPERPGDDKL